MYEHACAAECNYIQSVREAVSYRRLFTADWFGVREKHCFRLKIYDRLRASEQADSMFSDSMVVSDGVRGLLLSVGTLGQ